MLEVTKEMIELGDAGNCFSCPIALAASEKFPYMVVKYEPTEPSLRRKWILFVGDYHQYEVRGGAKFAKRFDSGLKVEPRKFRLVKLLRRG